MTRATPSSDAVGISHPNEAVQCLYTSACVNRHSQCVSTLSGSPKPLLAFGASHAICLATVIDAQHGTPTRDSSNTTVPAFRVLHVLHNHNAPVSAVRWISIAYNSDGSRFPYVFLVSVDTTGKVLLWSCPESSSVRLSEMQNAPEVRVILELQLPSSVTPNAVDGCVIPTEANSSRDLIQIMLTVAADTALFSWHANFKADSNGLSNAYTSDATIVSRLPSMCLCVRSICLPLTASQSSDHPGSALHLVFVGLDSGNIEIWSEHVVCSSPPGTVSRQLMRSATLVGHTDWVRCLDVCTQLRLSTLTAFIASGSQDHIVRLWRLYNPDGDCPHSTEDRSTLRVAELNLPEHVKLNLFISSESVLSSHDNWITGVSWETSTSASASFPPALLSCSMDRSLTVWAPPNQKQAGSGDEPNLWLEEIRVGDIGGTGLGFLDCGWLPSNDGLRVIIGHNFQGSVSLWSCEANTRIWMPGLPLCGHSAPVADLTWLPSECTVPSSPLRVLLTASADQTVRAHAPRRVRGKTVNGFEPFIWQELARPQVHGYDMNAVTAISPTIYVSAGDEKVARVFKATRTFFTAYADASGVHCVPTDQTLVDVAVQPTLGLSNQVASGDDIGGKIDETQDSGSMPHSSPLPTEDRLQHATVWPELKKLYGHAYEVYCIAAHPQLMLVASACVATKPQHAFIILWNGYTDWTIHARLMHHQLTVTQMRWSPNGRYLLAVSRDRTWSVWVGSEQKDSGENTQRTLPTYSLLAYPTKGQSHSRIIWTGAWSPDDRFFFTGSRDKAILAWNVPTVSAGDTITPMACVPLNARHTFSDAVTALDVTGLVHTPGCSSTWSYLMAVGLESGQLQLLLIRAEQPEAPTSVAQICWSEPILFSPELCHVKNKRVRQVAFEPDSGSTQRILASAADDGFVRLFEVNTARLLNLQT